MSEEDKEIAEIIASLDKKEPHLNQQGESQDNPKEKEKLPVSKEEPFLTEEEPENWDTEDIPEEFQ